METANATFPHRRIRRTVIDSYYKSSFCEKAPEYTFGTGSRPPLNPLEGGGPGPGAYPIKTTLGKVMESHIPNPGYFSLRGRTTFGDPYEKAISKTSKNEPGPGQYKLAGKFPSGRNPVVNSFPKATAPRDKAAWAPGPGSYEPLYSMGKQKVSTRVDAPAPVFPKADRPSLVPVGSTNIGPADYNPPPAACEPQLLSNKMTCATIKFGTGYKKSGFRKPDLSEPSPGPGNYKIPGSISTQARGSPYRDAPAISLSGREKFGSPWQN